MDDKNYSMILDIINDLVRMRQNLDFMDDTAKGVPQLKSRIRSIYSTLSSHQYEIPDLIDRSYHEGDNMIVTFENNPDLQPSTNRIKRVIKPMVSYKGKMIQAAEVIVEYN